MRCALCNKEIEPHAGAGRPRKYCYACDGKAERRMQGTVKRAVAKARDEDERVAALIDLQNKLAIT